MQISFCFENSIIVQICPPQKKLHVQVNVAIIHSVNKHPVYYLMFVIKIFSNKPKDKISFSIGRDFFFVICKMLIIVLHKICI